MLLIYARTVRHIELPVKLWSSIDATQLPDKHKETS